MKNSEFPNFNEWSYPEVDRDFNPEVKTQDAFNFTVQDNSINENEALVPQNNAQVNNNTNPAAKSIEVNEIDPNEVIRNELNQLKTVYEENLNFLHDLLTKLKTPLSMIDEEVIVLVQDIIKKVVKKIIGKEIATDSSLLVTMINELKATIDNQNGLLHIFISEQDKQKLLTENSTLAADFSVANDLHPGDIIIKSNTSEIRALLSERIEQLMRLDDE